jgi:hypothetical protein
MTKRVGKTPVRRAAVMPFAATMESSPVTGSVDRVDPPWVLAEVDEENDLIWRSSTIAKCWNELSGYRTR